MLYAIRVPGDFAAPYVDSMGRRTSNPYFARKFSLIADLDSYARSIGLASWEAERVDAAGLDRLSGQLAEQFVIARRASEAVALNGHAAGAAS